MRRAFTLIWIAYLVAIAVAVVVLVAAPAGDPLIDMLLADIAATVVIFAFSAAWSNSSFYDAYWSVAPPLLLAGWWWLQQGAPVNEIRVLLAGAVVLLWAVRLTRNWAIGWQGLTHADWRYVNLRNQLDGWYWTVSFLGVHLMPTLIVFAGCLPLYLLTLSSRPLNGWDAAGLVVGLAAVWIEAQADRELHDHRRVRASSAELLDSGVWSWCRHPNYLGEIGFWVALACFGLAAAPTVYWQLAGVVAMLVLFLVVSIPMIERKLAGDKPGYAAYRQRVPMLLPWGGLRR